MCAPGDPPARLQIGSVHDGGAITYDTWEVCPEALLPLRASLGPPDHTRVEQPSIAEQTLGKDLQVLLDQAHRDATNALSALQLGTVDGPDGPVTADAEWTQQLAIDAARLALRLTGSMRGVVSVVTELDGLGQTLLLGTIRGPLTAAEEVAGD